MMLSEVLFSLAGGGHVLHVFADEIEFKKDKTKPQIRQLVAVEVSFSPSSCWDGFERRRASSGCMSSATRPDTLQQAFKLVCLQNKIPLKRRK